MFGAKLTSSLRAAVLTALRQRVFSMEADGKSDAEIVRAVSESRRALEADILRSHELFAKDPIGYAHHIGLAKILEVKVEVAKEFEAAYEVALAKGETT